MLLERPRLHKLAAAAIDEIAAAALRSPGGEAGPDFSPITPEEILWLNFLAERINRPTPGDIVTLLDYPIQVGNIWLWPLSVGARQWLRAFAMPWFRDKNPTLEILAFAYAMVHSREPEIFRGLTNHHRTAWRLYYWSAGCSATLVELDHAVDQIIGNNMRLVEVGDDPSRKKITPRAADWGEIIAQLCHFFGQTPEHWLWEASEENITELLEKISSILPVEQSISDNSAKFGAYCKFRLAVAYIKNGRRPVGQDESGRAKPPAEPSVSVPSVVAPLCGASAPPVAASRLSERSGPGASAPPPAEPSLSAPVVATAPLSGCSGGSQNRTPVPPSPSAPGNLTIDN